LTLPPAGEERAFKPQGAPARGTEEGVSRRKATDPMTPRAPQSSTRERGEGHPDQKMTDANEDARYSTP